MRNKRLFIFLSVCFFFFTVSIGNTEEGLYINGYDWEKMSEGSQISFVEGWLKCGKAALGNMWIDISTQNKWDESIEFMKIQQKRFINSGVLIGGVTIGQIIDTMNEIYSDPRTKLMDIADIMPLVSGRLMQGWTLKNLDELIAIEVKLQRCEKEEKTKGQFIEECGTLRKERNSYLQKLQK